jgi:hypothetical protein
MKVVRESIQAVFESVDKHQIDDAKLKSKIEWYKAKYKEWTWLKEQSGFGWDPEISSVTAPLKVWEDLLAENDNKKYKWFRTNKLLFTEELDICFGKHIATGEFALTIEEIVQQVDSIDIDSSQSESQTESQIQSQWTFDDMPIEDDSDAIDQTPSSQRRKRAASRALEVMQPFKRERASGAIQIAAAVCSVSNEIASNRKLKEQELENKRHPTARALELLNKDYSEHMDKLETSEFIALMGSLDKKPSWNTYGSMTKAEFLLIVPSGRRRDSLVKEYILDVVL